MNVAEDARAANTFWEGSVHVSHMFHKMHKIVYRNIGEDLSIKYWRKSLVKLQLDK